MRHVRCAHAQIPERLEGILGGAEIDPAVGGAEARKRAGAARDSVYRLTAKAS